MTYEKPDDFDRKSSQVKEKITKITKVETL